jgi:hypothetical protein
VRVLVVRVVTTCATCAVLERGKQEVGWHLTRCEACGHLKLQTVCACPEHRQHHEPFTYQTMLESDLETGTNSWPSPEVKCRRCGSVLSAAELTNQTIDSWRLFDPEAPRICSRCRRPSESEDEAARKP